MITAKSTPQFEIASNAHKPTRVAFGEALLELGRQDPKVVALTADCSRMVCTYDFGQAFPDRHFNMGIAEQNLVGAAAGMASTGLVAFAGSYAPFLSMRACEQIRTDCTYTGFNVKIAAICGGMSLGTGGSTHHGQEDLAILRSMAKMTIVVPADARESYKATLAAAAWPGPVYLRLGRDPEPQVYAEDYEFAIGKAVTLRQGKDLTIIATGSMVFHAVLAADALAKEGVAVRVLNMHTIKPLDQEAIVQAAQETGRILTVEEHTVMGGLGGAVAEVVVAEHPVPMRLLGIPDLYATVGPTAQLRAQYGLSWEGIASTARQFIG